jgi:hypothetical protein
MTPELKEKLLLRMFGSLEYMEKFINHYVAAMNAADEGMINYKAHPPTDLKLRIELKPTIWQWEVKVLPNFRGMKNGAIEAIENARQGKFSTIRSCAGDLRGFGKSMDGITDEWWAYVDKSIREKYFTNLKAAMTTGDNIYWTLRGSWKEGELFNERITGPIDEQELLKYLQPGETV